jgi:hypothetical protein
MQVEYAKIRLIFAFNQPAVCCLGKNNDFWFEDYV